MTYRTHHGFIALLIVAFVTASSAAWIEQTHSAQAQTAGTLCPAGNYLAIDNATTVPTATALAAGPHQVSLSASSTLAPMIQGVRFTLDNQTTPLGRGIQLNTNPYWNMTWYTQITPGGTHSVGATLELPGGSCQITPVPVMLSNPTAISTLAINSTPLRFDGYTNEPRDFILQSTIGGANALDVTKWAYFQKSPVNLGAITPADTSNSFRFSAGTVIGDSLINVVAQYGGISRQLAIPVKVYAQIAPSTSQTTTNTVAGTTTKATSTPAGTTTTTTPSSPTAAATTTVAPTAAALPATADIPIKNCVTSKLSEQRYLVVTSGQERVTAEEFDALRQCFAIRNYVLQSNLVPVAADKTVVKAKPVSDEVEIGSATNPVSTAKDSSKQVLKFAGKAKPSTTVLLYIFSEPLVLSTSTDANGDWSYSLEDPLQPGSHEAFALVNKGDGNYERSEVFGFVLAKAEAASATSNGYSLKLDKNQPTSSSNRRPIVIYIIAVLALIVTVLVIVAAVLMRRSHHQLEVSEALPSQDAPLSDPVIVATDTQPTTTQQPVTTQPVIVAEPVLAQPPVVAAPLAIVTPPATVTTATVIVPAAPSTDMPVMPAPSDQQSSSSNPMDRPV